MNVLGVRCANGRLGSVAGFMGATTDPKATLPTPGATFTANPTDKNDFTFSWVQVLTQLTMSDTVRTFPVGAPPPNIPKNSKILDNWYPYAPPSPPNPAGWTTQFTTFDAPCVGLPQNPVN